MNPGDQKDDGDDRDFYGPKTDPCIGPACETSPVFVASPIGLDLSGPLLPSSAYELHFSASLEGKFRNGPKSDF